MVAWHCVCDTLFTVTKIVVFFLHIETTLLPDEIIQSIPADLLTNIHKKQLNYSIRC